jgi:DinB family protein
MLPGVFMRGGKFFLIGALALICLQAVAQSAQRSTADSVRGHYTSIHKQLLEMAKDFPADKYDFRLKPEMRSFGEVLVHVISGEVYAAKAGRGEKVNWDELDPKNYKTKDAIVALMEKATTDSEATLKGLSNDSFAKSVEPWLSVTEHSAEHYGLLVAYYRANGMVPPASRKQSQ